MIDGSTTTDQHSPARRALDGVGRAARHEADRTKTAGGSAAGARSGPLGNTANNSSFKIDHDHEEYLAARFELRIWAHKAALFAVENPLEAHRVALCGWATTSGASAVGVRVSNGSAGFANLQTCGSVWACPVCAAKVSAKRSQDLGAVLGWARREGHTLAMVTLTVSHQRQDRLKSVWDAVASGWGAITSGDAWKADESDEEFAVRLGEWMVQGKAHDDAKNLGLPAPRAPRGWHLGKTPTIRRGDVVRFGILGWARAVEVTRGANGWHVHIHAVMVLDGKENSHERAYALGARMRTRWNAGLSKKGFSSSEEHGVQIDVSAGAEQKLAEYLAKSAEPEKAVRQSMEKAGHDIAREVTLGQHKKAKRSGRTPFQILADLKDGDAEDWALWAEWLTDSRGRQQLTWSDDLRKIAGLLEPELTDEEEAAKEIGSVEDTILFIPVEYWRLVRSDSSALARILTLALKSPSDLKRWLEEKGIDWIPFTPPQEP